MNSLRNMNRANRADTDMADCLFQMRKISLAFVYGFLVKRSQGNEPLKFSTPAETRVRLGAIRDRIWVSMMQGLLLITYDTLHYRSYKQ